MRSDHPANRDNKYELRRLYGRAQGRPLSQVQQVAFDAVIGQYGVDPQNPLSGLGGFSAVHIEIGFGGAEHLIWQARARPDTAFIGAEPFLNGNAKAAVEIKADGLTNVRLHHGDARDVLDNVPDNSVDCVYVLFPDPWPKSKHNKRRIIRAAFVAEIFRILKPGGRFRFASDIIDYVDWALVRIFAHADGGRFDWPAVQSRDWLVRGPDWPGTRPRQQH